MIILNTLSDVQKMTDCATMEGCIADYLKNYFIALSMQLCAGSPPDNFSLEKYGCIVFLQNVDDCKILYVVGLHSEYKKTHPESVERIRLQGDNGEIELFNACVLINNEVCITVFSQKGTLDDETEQFLLKECS